MSIFSRLIPYVWPDRRKITLSIVFAVVIAVLWGANLTIAFPIVKVLLERQSLRDYVSQEIRTAEEEIRARERSLKMLEENLESAQRKAPLKDEAYQDYLQYRDRDQYKLSEASHTLMMMQWVQTYLIPYVPTDEFDTLVVILVVLMIATVLKNLAVFVQNVLIGSVVEMTIMRLRKECLKRTLHLDYQSICQEGTGNLMARFTYDMSVLANGLTLLGGKVLREPLKALACIIFAFYVNWQLTLLSLIVVPILGVIFTKFGRMLKQSSQASMESMSKVYKSLEEMIESIKVVIAFNGYRKHRQRFHRENKEYYRKSMQLITVDGLTSPLTELLGFVAVYIALLPGAYLVLRNTTMVWGMRLASEPMGIAELSVLYALLAGVLDPGRKMSSVFSRLKQSAVAAERIFSLIDRRTLVHETDEPLKLPRHKQSIEFRNVDFQYASTGLGDITRPPVLDDVTLSVKVGEVIALVGSNGSGKSTMVNLLPRFFDPQSGHVMIDDVDIRQVPLKELRAQIGIVTQETLLFDESVFENIRYGERMAKREDVLKAAETAYVTPFVEKLPEGFETHIGEKGNRLSGGQRQRIALARAILRDPPILILDEATSAVDAQSEQLIHQVLKNFVKGRTTFIVTHSLGDSMLDLVTRIAVMDRGRLVGVGTHDVLMQTCPVYQSLYQAQRAPAAA